MNNHDDSRTPKKTSNHKFSLAREAVKRQTSNSLALSQNEEEPRRLFFNNANHKKVERQDSDISMTTLFAENPATVIVFS